MEENREALEVMVKSLAQWVQKKIKKAQFDRTLFGTVTEVLDDGYLVNVAGQNHKIKSRDLNIPKLSRVRVTLPCNQWGQAYISSIV